MSKSSQHFIQNYNQLATPLILILKITGLSEIPAAGAIDSSDNEVVVGGGDWLKLITSSRMGDKKIEVAKN